MTKKKTTTSSTAPRSTTPPTTTYGIGDVVMLRSGSPPMTVSDPRGGCYHSEVKVVWWCGGEFQDGFFDHRMLVPTTVSSDDDIPF